jgi:hypothetical protein
VWIGDYDISIELAAQVNPKEVFKENLLVFCRIQGKNENAIEGFIPIKKVGAVAYVF